MFNLVMDARSDSDWSFGRRWCRWWRRYRREHIGLTKGPRRWRLDRRCRRYRSSSRARLPRIPARVAVSVGEDVASAADASTRAHRPTLGGQPLGELRNEFSSSVEIGGARVQLVMSEVAKLDDLVGQVGHHCRLRSVGAQQAAHFVAVDDR